MCWQPVGFVTFSTRAGAEAAKQDLQVSCVSWVSSVSFWDSNFYLSFLFDVPKGFKWKLNSHINCCAKKLLYQFLTFINVLEVQSCLLLFLTNSFHRLFCPLIFLILFECLYLYLLYKYIARNSIWSRFASNYSSRIRKKQHKSE